MKKTIFILLLLAAVACNNLQEPVQTDLGGIIPKTEVSRVIAPDEALNNLDELLSAIYGSTRADGSFYDRNDLIVFGGVTTKSVNVLLPDTTVYIVNFKDDSGYAVLSAQTGLADAVLCITEEGSLSSSELNNSFENISGYTPHDNFLPMDDDPVDDGDDDEDCADENCVVYIDEEEQFATDLIATAIYFGIETINLNMDLDNGSEDNNGNNTGTIIGGTSNSSGNSSGDSGSSGSSGTSYSYKEISKIGPYLETKWGQHSPFNDFRSDGAPAGCVAIATAQILACNEYGSYEGTGFDWTLLKTVYPYSDYTDKGDEDAQQAASDFLRIVGNHDNCRIKYDVDGSSSCAKRAKATFKNFGYKNVNKYLGYNSNRKSQIITQLTKGLPVYMDGSKKNNSGHAWVIDGVYVREKTNNSTGSSEEENLFHINWGWRGSSDGYFSQGVFDAAQRVATDNEYDSGGNTSSGNYIKWFRVVTYSK